MLTDSDEINNITQTMKRLDPIRFSEDRIITDTNLPYPYPYQNTQSSYVVTYKIDVEDPNLQRFIEGLCKIARDPKPFWVTREKSKKVTKIGSIQGDSIIEINIDENKFIAFRFLAKTEFPDTYVANSLKSLEDNWPTVIANTSKPEITIAEATQNLEKLTGRKVIFSSRGQDFVIYNAAFGDTHKEKVEALYKHILSKVTGRPAKAINLIMHAERKSEIEGAIYYMHMPLDLGLALGEKDIEELKQISKRLAGKSR